MNPLEYAQKCQAQEVQQVQKVQQARPIPAGIVGKRQQDYDAAISFYRQACAQKSEARDRTRANLIKLNKMIQNPGADAADLLAVAVDIIADGLGERPLRESFEEWKKSQGAE